MPRINLPEGLPTHRYAIRSQSTEVSTRRIRSSSRREVTEETYTPSPSARAASEVATGSSVLPAVGGILATGGVIATLYSFGQETAYRMLTHGAKWLGWHQFNKATDAHKLAEEGNFFTRYVATYTTLREEAQAGYLEGYSNVLLTVGTFLAVAYVSRTIYQKCTQ